ncbi:MAG: glycosyltransferase family 4 protein, partial [Pyramidobacter sp.]|nr:glycosyltransferase family 4 protein [Pyramidobacter sp.]
SGGKAAEYEACGMDVIEGDWSLPLSRPWKFFSVCRQIKQTVSQLQPDIIHLHFVTNVMMCRLALRHDSTPRLFQVPGPLHMENALTSFAERCTATGADYWAGACKKTCTLYAETGIDPRRIFLAYYGVPRPKAACAAKSDFRSEYGISGSAVIVAMLSYFYKPRKYLGQKQGIKGHEDFIDAMKLVVRKHPEAVAVIIGNAWDGAEAYEQQVRVYAHQQLGSSVIFTGYRSDVYSIYPEINIAVHPSHSENLGGAAESLMLGVPTISTDVGGFPDIVIPQETGCLAQPHNPLDLAQKISWAIEHPEQMREMANSGQALVRTLLDLGATADAVFSIYSQIKDKRAEHSAGEQE